MNGIPLDFLYQYYTSHPEAKFRLTFHQFSHYYTKWVNEFNCKTND